VVDYIPDIYDLVFHLLSHLGIGFGNKKTMYLKIHFESWVCWHMSLTLVLEGLKQEDPEFKFTQ
jgi:hypothetical protein